MKRAVILGAAGRDFHNFNVVFRDNPAYQVVAFTATQIPNIAGRRYPAELAGKLYPEGIPIYPENDLERLIRARGVDVVVFSYSDVAHSTVMHLASRAVAAGAVTLAILAAAFVVVTICSVALAGSAPVPSLSEIVQRDAAVLAFGASAALVCTGVATFVRSRGPVMASVIAFGVLISQLLLHVSFLGDLRQLLPLAAFERMAGDTLSGLSISLPIAIAVVVAWAVAALAAGGWWARRAEV